MTVKNLRQSTTIPASPHEVYEALIDPETHARFTGASAKMDRRVGGEFSHYDGSLEGVVVHLDPDRRVVLAWRASGWPKGHYSIADFVLKKAGKGTRLEFSQFGIPLSDFEEIAVGWKEYYWQPLRAYFGA